MGSFDRDSRKVAARGKIRPVRGYEMPDGRARPTISPLRQRGGVKPKLAGWLVLLLVAIGIALWVWYVPRVAERDLRTVLAEMLDIPVDSFSLNLPPKPSRYPGSILHVEGIPVELVDAGDPDLDRAADCAIEAAHRGLTRATGGLASPLFEQMARNERRFEMKVRIAPGRTVEMELAELRERIAQRIVPGSSAEQEATIVVRAHEGTIVLQLVRRRETTFEAWSSFLDELKSVAAAVPDTEVRISGSSEDEDRIGIEISQPFVIGFQASLVADVLRAGEGILPKPVRSREGKPDADAAVAALMRLDPANVPALHQALKEIGPGASRVVLLELRDARTDSDRERKLGAIRLIQALPEPPPEVRPEIEEVLRDAREDGVVRTSAAAALLALEPGSSLALNALRSGFAADDPRLRKEAAASVGRARLVVGVPLLQRALEDASPQVRIESMRSLKALGPRARIALPTLRAIEARGDTETRVAVRDAIRGIEDDR